jgi:hypothetical protein
MSHSTAAAPVEEVPALRAPAALGKLPQHRIPLPANPLRKGGVVKAQLIR